jgi:hypothetical protein
MYYVTKRFVSDALVRFDEELRARHAMRLEIENDPTEDARQAGHHAPDARVHAVIVSNDVEADSTPPPRYRVAVTHLSQEQGFQVTFRDAQLGSLLQENTLPNARGQTDEALASWITTQYEKATY